MVFDIGNRDSFLHLQKWEDDMKKYGVDKKAIVVVLANKTDLKRRVIIFCKDSTLTKSLGS